MFARKDTFKYNIVLINEAPKSCSSITANWHASKAEDDLSNIEAYAAQLGWFQLFAKKEKNPKGSKQLGVYMDSCQMKTWDIVSSQYFTQEIHKQSNIKKLTWHPHPCSLMHPPSLLICSLLAKGWARRWFSKQDQVLLRKRVSWQL